MSCGAVRSQGVKGHGRTPKPCKLVFATGGLPGNGLYLGTMGDIKPRSVKVFTLERKKGHLFHCDQRRVTS